MTQAQSLYNEAKAIAYSGGRLAFATSAGRDSAVMLHVMSRFTDLKKHAFFHWTPYPEVLPYQKRYLETVERKYGISIETRLCCGETKTKQIDFTNDFLDNNGCSFCLFGFRMDESLQRRGMLNKLTDGIDRVRLWAYPLRSWTKPKIKAYVRSQRLPLSPEYNFGMQRDMNEFRSMNAVYLREVIGEEDYQCAIRQDPNVEIDYMRCTRNGEEESSEKT